MNTFISVFIIIKDFEILFSCSFALLSFLYHEVEIHVFFHFCKSQNEMGEHKLECELVQSDNSKKNKELIAYRTRSKQKK